MTRDIHVPGTERCPFQEELLCHHVEAHITISLMLDRCGMVRQNVAGLANKLGSEMVLDLRV